MGVRLPAEYQEVEYLGNTGTQYIVTDYVPSADNVEVDLKYMFTASQRSDSMLFGSSTGYTTAKTYQCEKYNEGNWYIAVGRSNYRDVLGEYGGSRNAIHFIHADADILKIDDGSTAPSTFRSGDNQLPMALFAWTTKADGTVAYINKGVRIYAITFKENGVLTADYVPCYRKADDKPGMYDLVTGTFFTNQGTGADFIVGGDVIDSISPWLVARRRMLMQKPIQLIGYTENVRFGSDNSDLSVHEENGWFITGFVPLEDATTLFVRYASSGSYAYHAIVTYDANKNPITYWNMNSLNGSRTIVNLRNYGSPVYARLCGVLSDIAVCIVKNNDTDATLWQKGM